MRDPNPQPTAGIIPRALNLQQAAARPIALRSLRRDLQIVRNQIELYRVKAGSDPELIVNQWGDLVFNNYLHSPPVNPLNQNVTVAAAPDANIGWVWRDSGSGRFDIYGTDATGLAEFIE